MSDRVPIFPCGKREPHGPHYWPRPGVEYAGVVVGGAVVATAPVTVRHSCPGVR